MLLLACGKSDDTPPITPIVEEEEPIEYVITCTDDSFSAMPVQCTPELLAENLDVVTWNIENFPMESNTVELVADIIRNLNADIYAIQEIDDMDAFINNWLLRQMYYGKIDELKDKWGILA